MKRSLRVCLMIAASTSLMGFAMPTATMPPNTIKLSQLMRELSAKPGFTEAFLKEIEGNKSSKGAALLTPDLVDHLRELIVGKDWNGLDRFPGWTMAAITPTVGTISRIAAEQDATQTKASMAQFLDTGQYSPENGGILADFRKPSSLPGFTGAITDLGDGVTRGDGPSPIAPEHAESQRLADILNRLALNGMEGVSSASVTWNDDHDSSTPEELIAVIIASGHTVNVTDSRYFANFGHLHYKGQDVMMPFFVDPQIIVPGTKRPLLVPVSHAEYEWHIRGPILNADIAFYFGIDGKAEFRTMDELNQPWVMERDAHTYRDADALEVTRLAAAMVRTYMRLHRAHPATPFGGYYAFGVCQDVIAAIELKMTGKATLFPNTADDRFFIDPRDAEINALIKRLPKDRDSRRPGVERIFDSLPVGSSDAELAAVSIPGLGADLVAVHDAWTAGTLKRPDPTWLHRLKLCLFAAAGAIAIAYASRLRRRNRPA